VAPNSIQMIVIGALITLIARSVGIDSNPDNRVLGFKRLNLAVFEQIKLSKVNAGRVRWIYPRNYLSLSLMLTKPLS